MTFFEILEKINKIQKLQASENSNSRIEAEQDIKELENAVRGELFSLIRPLIQNTNFCELQIPAFAQSYGKYFNPGVYHELLCYTHLAHCFEPNGIPQEQALKLAILFADTDSALRYITNSGCTLHDACLFQLPPVDECHFPFWQKLAKKSMLDQRFRKLLPYANEIENLMMSAAKPKLDYQLINAKKNAINHVHHEWKQFKRKHGILNDQEKLKFQKLTQDLLLLKDELVELCKGISLHNTDLTILDAFYQYYQKTANPAYHYFLQNGLTKKDYDKFIALDRKDAGKNIPDLMVEGNEIGHPGFYLRKLPVHDDNYAALGACLGKLTNCCQSLSGEAGESCVIHGLTDPNGGFYILCKGDSKDQKSTDEILAQTWVWRSKLNVLVFDSVEISKKADIKMTVDFFRILAKDLVSKNFSPKVNCGNSSGISTRVGLNLNDVPEQFINYKGYTDSEHQNVVYKNNNPFHWYGNDHWYWYGKDQNYTAFINHKIHESIDENVPFAKVAFLCQGINWAISKQQFSILEGFKEIAKTLDRFDEIKNLIMSMELFVNKPTKNFIKDYEEQLKTYILNKQYCMDTFNNEGKTLLMVACLQGEENFAKFLLDHGADISLKDKIYGQTALHFAAESIPKPGNLIIKKLIEVGSNIEELDKNGYSALMLAVQKNVSRNLYCPYVAELIALGANVNAKNNAGDSILMEAVEYDNISVSKFVAELVKSGADINACNKWNETALIKAIENFSTDIALELIHYGADINIKTSRGKNALSLAQEMGLDSVIQSIKDKMEIEKQKLDQKNSELIHIPDDEYRRLRI